MNLLIGLGNPGAKYASTRHNIGFMVIDQILKNLVNVGKTWELHKDLNVEIYKNGDLIFAKPQTFMNASGFAVQKLIKLYKIPIENVWVIHDDIDLPLGRIRIRKGGSSAGHHGIESIMHETGSDGFMRFRLGVGKTTVQGKTHVNQNLDRHEVEKFVVSNFGRSEVSEVKKLIKQAAQAVETSLDKGLDVAMNQFN